MLSVTASYRYTARLTRAEAKNFFHTFRFLPPERRQSIFAVYAFSRRADDAVDTVREGGRSAEEVRRELDALRSCLGSSPPEDPLVPALQDTIRRYRIPRQPFEELLAGMAMDLVKKRYETFEDLYEYCYKAASVIGLICMEIFGYRGDPPREPAIKLGIAMQLTNILRDVAEDRARNRVYLPIEDLRRFNYTEEELFDGVVNDSFRELMAFQITRARRYFKDSETLFPRVLPESRFCPILLMRFYSRLLEHIERSRYDVFTRRPSLPAHEKILLATFAWLTHKTRGIAARWNGGAAENDAQSASDQANGSRDAQSASERHQSSK